MVSMELLSSSSLRSVHDTLITVRDFVAGELLLELPLSAALTKDSAQALPIIRFLDAEDGRPPRGLPHWAALPDDFVLALQLMHLRSAAPPLACDDDSATHPWLAWLEHAPLQIHGTPHWSDAERQWLAGSHVERRTRAHEARRDELRRTLLEPLRRHDGAFFGGADYSDAAFADAHALVHAHALTPAERGRILLLPLPLLPLEGGGGARLSLVGATGTLQLHALRPLPRGARVTVDAADFGHATLWIRQGGPGPPPLPRGAAVGTASRSAAVVAAAPSAPADGPLCTLPLELSLDGDGALDGLKELLLGKYRLRADGQPFELTAGAAPPPLLMPFARLVVLQEHDLHLLPPGELPLAPLGPANEEWAFRLVAAAAEAKLAAYPTTLDEDEYSLQNGRVARGSRRHSALVATLGEKRALSGLVSALSASLSAYLRALPTVLPPPAAEAGGASATGATSAASTAAAAVATAAPSAAARARASRGTTKARAAKPASTRAFNLSVPHGPVGLRLRRARASNACTWLVIDGTVDGSAAAADGRVAAGMLLRSVGGIAAASLSVRAVQQQLLGATPRAPVVLEIAPHSNSKEGPAWCAPAPE